VDVRKVASTGAAAAYVAKYLGKQTGRPWPRYSRRASYSLGRLRCELHPDAAGARCCTEARRPTFFSPTTIGRLSRAWADIAYAAGVGAGLIDPDVPKPIIDLWRWIPTGPRAPPVTVPNDELPEAELVRRLNARLDSYRRAAALEVSEPVPPPVVRALSGPRIEPVPGLLTLSA
jgi:hypothetical protein